MQSRQWYDYVTPEILAEIQKMFGDEISMESLKNFSYDHLPPEILELVDEQKKIVTEKEKAVTFEQEKKCNICNSVLVVEEANGQKYFTCKNIGDMHHRVGISQQELDKELEYLNSLPEDNVYKGFIQRGKFYAKEQEIAEFYKTVKKGGQRIWISFAPRPISGPNIHGTAYAFDYIIEVKDKLNFEEPVKGEGKVVERVICEHQEKYVPFESGFKFHRLLKTEVIMTGVFWGCQQVSDLNSYEPEPKPKLKQAVAEHRIIRVISQRLDAKLDEAIMNYFIEERKKGNYKYQDAHEHNWFVDEGIDDVGYGKWISARVARLAKLGKLKASSRGSGNAEWISSYISKINQYRYVPTDAVFLSEDEYKEYQQVRKDKERDSDGWKENWKAFFLKVRTNHKVAENLSITILNRDGEIITKERKV